MARRAVVGLLAVAALTVAGCGEEEPAGPSIAGAGAAFFGIAPQDATSDVDLTRMSTGGVGSYHLLLSWARVEEQAGVYDFSGYDKLVGKLATFGIEPITYVYGTPRHLAESQSTPPTSSEEAIEGWERFLTETAERYGPGGEFWEVFARTDPGVEPQPLRIWEIWNEPNGPAFWSPDPSPSEYATLLKRSQRTLQKTDPGAEIMLAGMFATPSKPGAIQSFDFLREMYEERGVAEAVDLVGIHPYGPRIEDVREQMSRTHEVLEEVGEEETGVWVTEIGWGSDPRANNQLAKTPARQATLLTRAYELMIERRERWNVRGVLWYTWRDAANPVGLCGWCASAGLVDDDLDPKPAWRAYTALTGGEAKP